MIAAVLAVEGKEERKTEGKKERKTNRKKERKTNRKKESKTPNGLQRYIVRNIPVYSSVLIVIRYRITHHSCYIFHIA